MKVGRSPNGSACALSCVNRSSERRINQDGAVTGGKDFDIGRPGPAGGSDEGHESPRCEISAKRLMDMFESRRKILRYAEVASRIRVADCCKQCRAYAVTSDIGKADDQLAVGHGLPIEVVAAGIVGRLVPAGNVESINLWLVPGKK